MSLEESIQLNLETNLATEARAAAEGASAFAKAVGALGEAGVAAAGGLEKLRSAVQQATSKALASEATAAAKALADEGKAATAAAAAIAKAKQQESAAMAKTLADRQKAVAEQQKQATKQEEDAGDAAQKAMTSGGGAIVAGAAAAAAIIAKVVAAIKEAIGLLDRFLEFGIQQTSAAEKQKGILDKLTHGKGELTYKLALEIAGETGLDPATAVDRMKGLLEAKFSNTTIKLLVQASADLGAVKGDEKGKALLDVLEKLGNLGKADERSMKALANAGVNLKEVMLELRKGNETLAQTEARLKAGKISAEELAVAVGKVVEKDVGGVAGKGLDAILNKLKIQFNELFTGFDLSPLKNAAKALSELLGGEQGEKLKKALGDMGSAAIKALFGPFEGAEGKQRLIKLIEGTTKAAAAMAKVFVLIAPVLAVAADAISAFAEALTAKGTGEGENSGLVKTMRLIKDLAVIMGGVLLGSPTAILAGVAMFTKDIADMADIDLFGGGMSMGDNLVNGFVSGIEAGIGKVAAAASAMAQSALDAVANTQQSHSPSKKFGDLGDYAATGYGKAMNDNAAPEKAAAAMASRALGAAAGPSSAARLGASGGSSSGNTTRTINITNAPTVHVPPGSSAETQASAKAGSDASNANLLAQLRQAMRDENEAA